MSKARTIEIAALIGATDRNGRVDPTRYEAERLILENRRVDGIDADALARAIPASPAYEKDREGLLEAIRQRLDTPHELKRYEQALDKSNISDSPGERVVEWVGETVGDAYAGAKAWGERFLRNGDESATEEMSWAYQHAESMENDPDATEFQRQSARLARQVIGDAQHVYGLSAGATVHGLEMVNDFVDLAKMGYRFSTDENYRDLLIATAKLYAAETMDDPGKPLRDLRNAGAQALENWEKEYEQAKAEGRGRQFLGETQGAVGLELVATLIPVSKLAKFGKIANAVDAATPDALDEAAGLAGDADRVLRRADEAPAVHPGETAAEAAERSARATEAAQDVAQAQIRLFRDAGKLDELIDAARRTGNIEGLLRSGELAPGELSEILRRDSSVFEGKVGFLEALDISTNGVDLTKLSKRQLGDIGEALHTYDLVKAGHTDIVSIKNASGHGIDVVSRDPTGKLQFDEVKTSAKGRAEAQSGDPVEFVLTRLDRAIDQISHWAEKNTMPGLADIARELRREIADESGRVTEVNAKWVQMNLGRSPGSSKLDIDKTVEDWVKPEPKKQSFLQTLDPDEQAVHQRIVMKAKEKGLGDEHAENLAAEGLLSFKRSGSVNRADDIDIYGDRLFISSFPYGHGRDPSFHVNVDVASAAQKPAQETLQQVAVLDQQQFQERLAQQAQQPDGPNGPAGPTIGPRIL